LTDVSLVIRTHFTNPGGSEALPSEQIECLTPRERAGFAGFQFQKRRQEWLLGRLAAKHVVCDLVRLRLGLEVPAWAIEVGHLDSGAPVVLSAARSGLPFAFGERLPIELSLSHSHGAAFCGALWQTGDSVPPVRLGVDLEWVTSHPPEMWSDYFTGPELRHCTDEAGGICDRRATLVWSAKESALKALRHGLTIDTRGVTCLPALSAGNDGVRLEPDSAWRPLSVAFGPPLSADVLRSTGRWHMLEGFAVTVVVVW